MKIPHRSPIAHALLLLGLGALAQACGGSESDGAGGTAGSAVGGKGGKAGSAAGGKGGTAGSAAGASGSAGGAAGGAGGAAGGAAGAAGGAAGAAGGAAGAAGGAAGAAGGAAGAAGGAAGAAGGAAGAAGGAAGAAGGAAGAAGGAAGAAGGAAGAAGGAAGAAGGAGGSGGAAVLTCGSAPYARARVAGNTLVDHPTGPISITGSTCPTTTVMLNPASTIMLDVPDKTAMYLVGTQTGSRPSLTPEFKLDKDSLVAQLLGFAGLVGVQMVATDVNFAAIDPGWSTGTHASITLLTGKADSATGTCADTGGITYAVQGHPEAIVGYSGGATATTSGSGGGGVSIFVTTTGTLTAPEMLTIVGTKTGCTVATTGFTSGGAPIGQTGKIPVAGGATTGIVAAAVGN